MHSIPLVRSLGRSTARMFRLSRLLSLGAILAACSRAGGEPKPRAEAQAASPTTAPPVTPLRHPTLDPTPSPSAAPPASPEEVVWEVPKDWRSMPARMMRKATYEAPGAAGPAEIGVFHFGAGQGGGVEANVQRWIKQFAEAADQAKRSQERINGMKVSIVEIDRGTFHSGMPGGPTTPKPDWALYGCIVETPVGDYFFKMTGPAATVSEQKANLKTMLSTLTVLSNSSKTHP